MRKYSVALVACVLSFALMIPQTAKAEIPVKARAFMTIVGYGAAGGAILGAASMAFGTSTRAVAQGASLGLYAGIIFGTYVLVSHNNRRYGDYEDSSSPYKDSQDIYEDGYDADEGGSSSSDSRGGFFNRMESINTKFQANKKGGNLPPVYMNLFNYQF